VTLSLRRTVVELKSAKPSSSQQQQEKELCEVYQQGRVCYATRLNARHRNVRRALARCHETNIMMQSSSNRQWERERERELGCKELAANMNAWIDQLALRLQPKCRQ